MEQLWYAKKLVGRVNFGKRGEFDGTYDQQLTGILAQTAVADYLKEERPKEHEGGDGGVDFVIHSVTIDLKTMTRTVPMEDSFVHNLYGAQAKFNTDILLFSSYNRREDVLTLCGYLPKKTFLNLASFYPQGSIRTRKNGTSFKVTGKHGNYEVCQSLLLPFNNKNQFFREMKRFKEANHE